MLSRTLVRSRVSYQATRAMSSLIPGSENPHQIVNCVDKDGRVDNFSSVDNVFNEDDISHRQLDSTGIYHSYIYIYLDTLLILPS